MDLHEVMILLERIESSVQLVAEGVSANAQRHKEAANERRALGEAHEQTHLRLRGVETRLDSVETRLGGVEVRLAGVETQVTRVETRIAGVESKSARG